MQFVLDCSVAISWCLPDETNPDAETILTLLAENSLTAVVPSIWWLEIVNVLVVAERRGRIGETQTAEALTRLRSLSLLVDEKTDRESTQGTLTLARQYNLAAYDAAYLELAIREDLSLATPDNRLAEAARQCGVFLEVRGE